MLLGGGYKVFGIWGILGKKIGHNVLKKLSFIDDDSLQQRFYQVDTFSIVKKTAPKFEEDRVFSDCSSFFLALDGVVYNYSTLKRKYEVQSNSELLMKMYQVRGIQILNELNGNFCLVIFDRNEKSLYLASNHSSYKPLFYYTDGRVVLFSSVIDWLLKSLKTVGCEVTLDYDASVSLLVHGYMLSDQTLVKKVRKIEAGHYIKIDIPSMQTEDYCYLNYDSIEPSIASYDELLENANYLFKNAVKLVYEKDNEYNYKHFCTLSGGLDSRSVAFVADGLGYEQDFFTMGESGCLDIRISSEIAKELNGKHMVLQLGNGYYLLTPQMAIQGNGGTITYPGFMHLYELFNSVSLREYGSIITGELGDVVFGGSKNEYHNVPINLSYGAFLQGINAEYYYSEGFREALKGKYKDAYSFVFYNRGLNSACNGWLASNYFTESSSPFIDKDFLVFMYSIPPKFKAESQFYIDWMKRYYTKACDYKWTTTRTKPNASSAVKFLSKAIVFSKVRFFKQNLSMNPYSLWIKNNPKLQSLIQRSFSELCGRISNKTKLLELIKKTYETGDPNALFMIVTLNVAIDEYNIDTN